MKPDRIRLALAGHCLGGLLVLLAGCGEHGGIVRGVVYSEDGRVVMYHSENAGEGTYVADRGGAVRVGRDGAAFLSRDGRYVFLVDRGSDRPRWPGDRLVLYDVAQRSSRTGRPVPEKLYNPQSLLAKDGWEPELAEVYFGAGPAVTMGVDLVKFNERPARATAIRYVCWQPGGPLAVVPRPEGAAGLNREQKTDAPDSWVLVRQPDGAKDPFRTVWVHPDGTVVELLRSSQGFGATSFCVIAFPFLFWSPSYYRMAGWLTEANRADPAARKEEGPRLAKLIAARKVHPAPRPAGGTRDPGP